MKETEFLNIDLDISSEEDISELVIEIGKNTCVLNNSSEEGVFEATFETGGQEPNQIINEFVSIINELSPKAKAQWEDCKSREFNIGYDGGESPNVFVSALSGSSIKGISEINGEVVITIYGCKK